MFFLISKWIHVHCRNAGNYRKTQTHKIIRYPEFSLFSSPSLKIFFAMFKESQKSLRQGLRSQANYTRNRILPQSRAWRDRIIKKCAPISASFFKIQKQQITFLSCLLWEWRNKVIRLPRIQRKNDVNLLLRRRKPGTSLMSGVEGRWFQGPLLRSKSMASERAWVYVCVTVYLCVFVCMLCFVVFCVLVFCCVYVVVCAWLFVYCWCGCVLVLCVCCQCGWVFSCLFILVCMCCCVFACVYYFVCVWLFLWGGGLIVAERVWQQPRGPAEGKQIVSTAKLFSSVKKLGLRAVSSHVLADK